jgi:hypothetical protein
MPTSKDLSDLDSQLKKTVISAEGFKRGSSLDFSKSLMNIHKTLGTLASHTRKLVIRVGDLEKTVNNNSRKITSLKNISKTQSERISGTNLGAKLPGSSTSNVEDNITAISKSVSSIAEILSGRKKLLSDTAAYEKRKEEQDKRALAESKLEKRFEGLKRTAEKIIAPVKSLLDKIIDFFVTIFLGRIVYKLLEWFGNKENADKVRSVIRFLGDHWPKLLALYLTFGTSFGKFSRTLIKVVARGAFLLAGAIAKLIGARKAAGFLGGRGGKLASAVIGTAVTLGGTYAATQALKGSGEEPKEPEQKAQGLVGGGYVRPRFPAFAGGGFNFKNMFGGASIGSMFGPLGMMLGAGPGAASGFVSGEKGVDKVPAMLSDGEFVMSRGAVQKYGVDTLEAMNAAGGGTNKPKIMSGTTYAAGGGYVGNDISSSLRSKYDAKHGAGSYDKQLAEKKARFAQEDAVDQARRERIANNASARKRARYGKTKPLTKATPSIPQIKVNAPTISSISSVSSKGQAEKDARKKARAEYVKIINNPDDPRYQDAWDGKITIDSLKVDIKAKQPTSDYKPYVSRFAGARDAAHERASRIRGSSPYVSPFAPGGMFGGPRMQARTDYAASKGKYYSSSDQKTYGSYNDAMAAKKSRMTSLASQQRLDKLSYAGASRNKSRGVRIDVEDKARSNEFKSRGGLMGQLGRFSTRIFGGEKGRARVAASDKASAARVKQTGAASIGRYYSSSDGKYYKDYNAAVLAKKQRVKSGVKPPVKPAPKYTPAGGGMGGARGTRGKSSKAKVPQFSAATKGSTAKASVLGVHR